MNLLQLFMEHIKRENWPFGNAPPNWASLVGQQIDQLTNSQMLELASVISDESEEGST